MLNHIKDFHSEFKHRHIGLEKEETNQLLQAVGVENLDALIQDTIPDNIRLAEPLKLPESINEATLLNELKEIAAKNKVFKNFIGQGYYNTITPGVILRNVFENPGWYTAYTPYQAEIAQGRLEALLNFQTMVSDLTGLEIANASLLDEATATAEAMSLMFGKKKRKQGNKLFVDQHVFPQTLDVLYTRAAPLGIEVEVGDYADFNATSDYFGVIVQYPNANGDIPDYAALAEKAHGVNAMFSVIADTLSLTLLKAPGEFGADIAVGSTQRFGIPLGYGGPHAAYFATKEAYKRNIPGRIIGVSIDQNGDKAFRMALQTREQHIRREKATSNICTAQVLLANMAGFYAAYHGPKGLKKIAERIHLMTCSLAANLEALGYQQENAFYFDTLKIQVADKEQLEQIRSKALAAEMNFHYFNGGNSIGISLDETTSLEDINAIAQIFAQSAQKEANTCEPTAHIRLPEVLLRKSDYLTHPNFNRFHSETEMLRYIKRLENKDLSLTHSMIALGSCTMKLNATTEMQPLSWDGFSGLHPFAPLDQTKGYQQIFDELSDYLKEITGFAGMSLQPNAGAQGEYAGLLVIRDYLKAKGENQRKIALIPSSAHGTNPASAKMAGMDVVIVKCDEKGNIDVADLEAKAEKHKNELAALMVTYPSTHGVFEKEIRQMCEIIHERGGQVYMDGANMNAQVGLTSPGTFGADVCHLNLHKTFCIPHGGGGPGMGPIGVAEHLIPHLPGHVSFSDKTDERCNAVSAAPWGSASILLISYAFIRLMGEEGLTKSTQYAILKANYIQARLKDHYETLYTGAKGRVAHEMIIDTRVFKKDSGIEVEDIAKRLMDYGFHAPTMSFPVAGTMMIEPTESESKEELDRFCDAMIAIKAEIDEVASGKADAQDNVLKNAPHTMQVLMGDEWKHAYSREKAAFPLSWLRVQKFWPSVGRIDSTYGDRNLMCTCPPLSEYEEEMKIEA